jgi:hypothetical protein
MSKTNLEAFNWLDKDFEYAVNNPWSPDAAMDWIYMMGKDDWQALNEAFNSRSNDWKCNCLYILGTGPLEGLPLLKAALDDINPEVAFEAALGYSRLFLNNLEEGEISKNDIEENTIQRLREIVKENPQEEEIAEIEEFLCSLDI